MPTFSALPRFAASRRRCFAGLVSLMPAVALACGGPQASPASQAPTRPPATEQPRPQPTAVPTTPPPTPTPVPVNPLTGQPVAEAASVQRRIVGVKIDNAPEARPQFGLSEADLVYEELAEGGLTRFLAMYLTKDPERIGPVRSARLTDIYLGEEWDFLLAYAGAGKTTGRLLGEALIPLFKAPELGEKLEGTPYFRDPKRVIPHNMFVHVDQVREEAKKDPGIAPVVEIRPFPFRPAPAELGPLRTLHMPYIPAAAVVWNYDPDQNVWKRIMAGAPHVDALNNQQIQVENVLIQFVNLFTSRTAEPDSAGNPVLDAELRGDGKLMLFHSGMAIEGAWSKEHDRAKTAYKQADGSPLPFRPGKVWIHIVPLDFNAAWT